MDMKCKLSLWSLHYCFIMATVTKDTVLTYTSALFSICHFILSFWLFEGQTPQLHGPTNCVRVQGDDGGGNKPLSLQHLICHIKWNFWLSQQLTFLPAQHFFLEIYNTYWEGITFICSDSHSILHPQIHLFPSQMVQVCCFHPFTDGQNTGLCAGPEVPQKLWFGT